MEKVLVNYFNQPYHFNIKNEKMVFINVWRCLEMVILSCGLKEVNILIESKIMENVNGVKTSIKSNGNLSFSNQCPFGRT